MKLGSKRLISASITGGIHSPTMSPYLPVNSKDIARQALDAAKAGAAVVHIHARYNETGKPSAKLEDFGDIIDMIREENDDVVICVTTGSGLGMTTEKRTRAIPVFKPA